MNNLFSGICGISETELINNFQPELHALAEETGKTYGETLAEMKKRYDGYRFVRESEDMYNPYSLEYLGKSGFWKLLVSNGNAYFPG
jgi:hypothetical protein